MRDHRDSLHAHSWRGPRVRDFLPKNTRWIGQRDSSLSSPGIGPLIRQVELARIGYIVGTLLKAGVPITDTLQSLHDTAAFYHYQSFYGFLKKC